MYSVDKDAFSSGQITSKLWMCEILESLNWKSNLTQIYGGWYGLSAFLLLSRGIYQVDKIQSFDIDPICQSIADMINENWVWQDWKFKAYTHNCNIPTPTLGDVIINTSTEHFDSKDWFNNLPDGTRLILQGNDMIHTDHVFNFKSLTEFINTFPISQFKFQGERKFQYPNWSFTRFMTIGYK